MMKRLRFAERCAAVAALLLTGGWMSRASASQVIVTFASPSGNVGDSQTYSSGGLSLTATGYDCQGNLCANVSNTNYSSHETALYDNSIGLGLADNRIGSYYEIPNTQFVQLNLSSILANNTVSSIVFTVTDVQTAWSLYTSSTAGKLKGSGTQLVNNAPPSTTTYTLNSPTLSADSLISILGGTNCDVVLNQLTINYTSDSIQSTPEPGSVILTGLGLVGLAAGLKKVRRKA
ncbi:MAG TPA: PEP-CTERM sorting domain-containing protein [Bryobacteraceae bacterium]|nr:PEP-CTERM sorting domain-containing protein [Bryobacteraceae bacterium]